MSLPMSRGSTLWLRMRYQWYVLHWLPVLLVAAMAVTALLWHGLEANAAAPPGARRVDAIIVAFPAISERDPQNRTQAIIARTENGLTGRQAVWSAEISGCRVGDPIEAYERGMRVYLRPAPCR